jgi:hypothetical protein
MPKTLFTKSWKELLIVEALRHVSSEPVADDLYILGYVTPPTHWELIRDSDTPTRRYVVNGLLQEISEVVRRKLRGIKPFTPEIRLPQTLGMSDIDHWHQDGMSGAVNGNDFWFILWNNAPMTEFIRLPQSHWTAPRFSTSSFFEDAPAAPPGERVEVPDNAVMLIHNNHFVHRRPIMDKETSVNRWFSRYFPEDMYSFNHAVEEYVRRFHGIHRELTYGYQGMARYYRDEEQVPVVRYEPPYIRPKIPAPVGSEEFIKELMAKKADMKGQMLKGIRPTFKFTDPIY